MMRDSPRLRRLRSDRRALERLREESSILDFSAFGDPTERYIIRFNGRGLWRAEGTGQILLRDQHEVTIQLGASYPRMMPDLMWRTPIFHPNISASGIVCLGGYGTHWVPSLNLDELCEMLWDMIRYRNFDTQSPYNRDAAVWARQQQQYVLPIDPRSIRDRVAAGMTRRDRPEAAGATASGAATRETVRATPADGVVIIDAELVEPPVVEDQDIVFLD